MEAPRRDAALALDPARLVALMAEEGLVAADETAALGRIARSLQSHFHHELLPVKSRLRAAWSELEQDGAARATSNDQSELAKDLHRTVGRLLARANYVAVPVGELHEALRRESTFGLRIDLDLDDYDVLATWRRRESTRTVVRRWLYGLRKRKVPAIFYDRFVVFARFKGAHHFADPKRLEGKLGARPGGVTLRLYRDVPKHDVEALFPGVRIRMRIFDRALLGLPAAAGAIQILNLKLLASLWTLFLALLVFLGLRTEEPDFGARSLGQCAGLAVLVTFAFRQWARFLGRKNLLHRQLAEHLQGCTLDHGFGVLLHLLEETEAQETAEAVLAYVLLRRSGAPLTAAELDARVEAWLGDRLGLAVDFEEEDALAKLRRLGLVATDGDGRVAALPPAAAGDELARRWAALLR